MNVKEQLARILAEYGEEITEGLIEATEATGKATTKQLAGRQQKTPIEGRAYNKGWKVTAIEQTWKGVEATIYNANKPRLTHILNDGWTMRNGQRHPGDGHIDRAEDMARELFEKEVISKL